MEQATVFLIVAVAFIAAVRRVVRIFSGGGDTDGKGGCGGCGCGGGCGGCDTGQCDSRPY